MDKTRLWLAAILLITAQLPAFGTAAAELAVEPLGGNAYLFRHGGHRSLFVIGENGVIVTDPINPQVAAAYRQAIAGITNQPVRYVVYSHYHWDRIAGAEIFTREGARVVAPRGCVERLRVNPHPDVVQPELDFDEQSRLDVGSASLELHDFGPAHSDCLAVFVARPANVMQLVEVVNPPVATFPHHPLASYIRPHNLKRFFAAVDELVRRGGVEQVAAWRALADENAPTGFSPAAGPTQIIADQAAFWRLVDSTTLQAAEEGRVGIDSFVRLKDEERAAFAAYAGFDAESLPLILRRFTGYHDMGR